MDIDPTELHRSNGASWLWGSMHGSSGCCKKCHLLNEQVTYASSWQGFLKHLKTAINEMVVTTSVSKPCSCKIFFFFPLLAGLGIESKLDVEFSSKT